MSVKSKYDIIAVYMIGIYFVGDSEFEHLCLFKAERTAYKIILIKTKRILPDPKRENSNTGMIGYWLDEAQWEKGYIFEAASAVLNYGFNKLGLTLISANCYPQNKRSQRVLEKMGFAYEGILHQAEVSYDGKIYDHLCYYLEKNNLK